jgi:Domain of unknown function (DUF6379)
MNRGELSMYQHHTILPGGLANIADRDGAVTGFRVQVRIGFPRGMPLSMVEGFAADVDPDGGRATDAVHAAPTGVLFRLRGFTYRIDDMADIVDQRWEMGEVAELLIAHNGGLTPGFYIVTVTQFLRVGPTPEPAKTVGRRLVELSEDVGAATLEWPPSLTVKE